MFKYKKYLVIWILSLVVFAISLYIGGIQNGPFNENPSIIKTTSLNTLSASIIIGAISFLLLIFNFIKFNKNHVDYKKTSKLKTFFIFLITVPIFPLYLIYVLFKSFRKNKPRLKDIRWLILFVNLFVLIPVWLLAYTVGYYGSTDELVFGTRYQVNVSKDSPSMMPSFPGNGYYKYFPYKNVFYKLNRDWAYKFQKGDVISFSTPVTNQILGLKNEKGRFVKRIIALPNDKVELKGGVVFINNKPLIEPYTLEPFSTFPLTEDYSYLKQKGINGLFLQECQKITVPKDSFFVLGDNRKNSEDSRVIGFVNFEDVHGFLSIDEQKKPYYEGVTLVSYVDKWRNTNKDYNKLLKLNKLNCNY